MDVLGLGAAYNLQAWCSIHIKKLQANRAELTLLNADSNAENKTKASAEVNEGLGNICSLFNIKFNCSANTKINKTYNRETKYVSAF